MAVVSRTIFGPARLSIGANVSTLLYTVPADRTAIIRKITLVNASNTPCDVILRLNGAGTGANIIGKATIGALGGTPDEVQRLYLVIGPGGTIHYLASVALALVISAHGSLLEGTPV